VKYFIGLLYIFLSFAAYAQTIDLSKSDFYIRKGFDLSWAGNDSASQAIKIEPVNGKLKTLRINDLFKNYDSSSAVFFWEKNTAETYTIKTFFYLNEADFYLKRPFNLHMAMIGQNFEIFINGNPVRSEINLDSSGNIQIYRTLKNVNVLIDSRHLKPGKNVLAFRIICDKLSYEGGIHDLSDFSISPFSEREPFSKKIIDSLIALYLFIGLYQLAIFLYKRTDRYTLYFGLLSILLSAYIFIRSPNIYALISDTSYSFKMEVAVLYLFSSTLYAFVESGINKKISTICRILALGNLLAIILNFSFSLTYSYKVLYTWQAFTGLAAAGYTFFLIRSCAKSFLIFFKQSKNAAKAFRKMFFKTFQGNIFIGGIIIAIFSIIDIIDSLFMHNGYYLTQYGFVFFIISLMIILTNRYVMINKSLEHVNRELLQKINETEEIFSNLKISENKYRTLTEGVPDSIFSMDEKGNFLSYNKALIRHLSTSEHELSASTLFDYIYEDGFSGIKRGFMKEKINEALNSDKQIIFKIPLKTRHDYKYSDFNIRLEKIDVEGRKELIGFLTHVADDYLLKFLSQESHTYIIDNSLSAAEDMSYRLVRNLPRYMNANEITLIRTGLREIIINAIEHGNLQISSDDKSDAMIKGEYYNLLQHRQNIPEYKNKKVTISYILEETSAKYTITDEGKGFKHEIKKKEIADDKKLHGRGIMMAQNIFDSVKYNKSGNSVTLTKNFTKQ